MYKFTDTAKSIYQFNEDWGMYDFDLLIQRGKVWDDSQKSKLIHSALIGVKIPELIFYMDSDTESERCIDGKQRSTTFYEFYNDGFPLSEDTPDVDGERVAGLKKSELPQALEKRFENAMLSIVRYENLTEEERDELFIRYNNGRPLTSMEINKALVGSKVLMDLEPLRTKRFVQDFLTKNQLKKNKDSYLVWQVMMLLDNDSKGRDIGEKSVREYSKQLKNVGIDKNMSQQVIAVMEYLKESLPVVEKSFNKLVEFPMLFITANEALKEDVPASKFGGWIQKFYSERKSGDDYAATKQGGTATASKVQARINIILEDMEQNIKTAPDYKVPEVNTQTKRRGRKAKINTDNKKNDKSNVEQTA